jgi:hypothetical protein
MSETQPPPEPETRPGPPCRHLRHKGMYVYTDGDFNESHDDYDSSLYWCLQSMKCYGPDDDLVDRQGCCNASRPCYEPV